MTNPAGVLRAGLVTSLLLLGCDAEPLADDPGDGRAPASNSSCPGSTLFNRVRDVALAFADRGTLPSGSATSCRNQASPSPRIDAKSIFGRVAELVVAAEHEVALQNFSFDPAADPARTFLAAVGKLERRLRAAPPARPVVVRLLLNTSGGLLNGAPPREELLRGLTGELQAMKLDPRLVRYELSAHFHVTTESIHSKAVIVDGRVAMVTGANMNHWDDFAWGEHDAGFELEGEVARSLLAEFDDAWARSQSWNVTYCGPLPWPLEPLPEGECLRDNPGPPQHALPTLQPPAAQTPMLVAGRRWKAGLQVGDHANPQDQAFLTALQGAARSIRIRTPNLNVAAVKTALVHGLIEKKALTVQVILAKGYEDLGEQFDGGTNEETVAELYRRLRSAGIDRPCDRLQVRWWSRLLDGVTPVEGNLDRDAGVNRPSHVKYSSYDGQLAIVGSANLDNQSWSRSREVNVVVDSPATVTAWDARLFGSEWDGAVPVDECR